MCQNPVQCADKALLAFWKQLPLVCWVIPVLGGISQHPSAGGCPGDAVLRTARDTCSWAFGCELHDVTKYSLCPKNLTLSDLSGVNAKLRPTVWISGDSMALSPALDFIPTLYLTFAAAQHTQEPQKFVWDRMRRSHACMSLIRRNSTFLSGHTQPLGSKPHFHNTFHILPFWSIFFYFLPIPTIWITANLLWMLTSYRGFM